MSRYSIATRFPKAGLLFRARTISNAYETIAFIKRHRRLPRFSRSGYLNDLLFVLRASESDLVLRSFTSDKEFVKIFVRGVTGEELCVPTLDVIRRADDLDDYAFPEDCIAKPTHLSGEVVFIRHGDVSDEDRARMKSWFGRNLADLTGEQNYACLDPKIIIEPWLRFEGKTARDFKVHVHQGKVTMVDYVGDRNHANNDRLVFNRDWEQQNVHFPEKHGADWRYTPLSKAEAKALRPRRWHHMVEIAETIGRHFPYVRVDFYTDGEERIYIGELTHISDNARKLMRPVEFERRYVTG